MAMKDTDGEEDMNSPDVEYRKKSLKKLHPTADGESDMDVPYKHGGKVKKKKRGQHKVRGEKSRDRLDKKKR